MESSVIPGSESQSWNQAFTSALAKLAIPLVQREPLIRAYQQVSREWGERLVLERAPFSSGVCPDGSPVEVSVQVRRRGSSQARFIAQPFEPAVALEAQGSWAAERLVAYSNEWAGSVGAARVMEAVSIYSKGSEPSFSGNFWFWLGLAASPEGQGAAKVYFNPWACQTEFRGAYAIYHLLKCSGVGLEGLRLLAEWTGPNIAAMPHIVGWNLGGSGVSSVKLYLNGVFDVRTLDRIVDVTGDPSRAWRRLFDCGVALRPRGEVHLAMVCRPGAAPAARFNFFCLDWFRSDEQVLRALLALFPEWPSESFAGMECLCREKNRIGNRAINFIGVDDESLTVYMNII